jgi:hypothetical protein
MIIKVIKKVNEGDPDYDAIDEPYYYKVWIEGMINNIGHSFQLKKVYDYYPPDPNDDSEINDGVLPALYGKMGNSAYYNLLSQVKKIAHMWEVKHSLSPETLNTFGDLIDEL